MRHLPRVILYSLLSLSLASLWGRDGTVYCGLDNQARVSIRDGLSPDARALTLAHEGSHAAELGGGCWQRLLATGLVPERRLHSEAGAYCAGAQEAVRRGEPEAQAMLAARYGLHGYPGLAWLYTPAEMDRVFAEVCP